MKRTFMLLTMLLSFTIVPSVVLAATRLSEISANPAATFLTHPVVTTFLITLGLLGIVFELFSPGMGAGIVIGFLALAAFFYGHLSAGIADERTLLFFVMGVALVVLEFFIPGGIVGVLGTILVIASFALAIGDATQALISLSIAILASTILIFVMVQLLKKRVVLFNRFVLTEATSTEEGYVSNVNREDLLGKVGRSITLLRPAGTADFNGERIDVVTEGNYIEANQEIVVVQVEGVRIVVREK